MAVDGLSLSVARGEVFKTEGSAGGMGRAVVIILAMIGSVSPFKWALISFEGGLWREFTMSQMLVPCGMMLASGVAGFVVGRL